MQPFTQLYERHSKDVSNYLFYLTHEKTLAEDLASETFLSAMRALPRFDGRSDIKTWLFSIARHKWYEHLRKEKKGVSLEELTENYLTDQQEPYRLAAWKELSGRVQELLKAEEPRTRIIVQMRMEGYSYLEIAKKASVSEASARVIDFRAKRKIRDVLLKEGFEYE